jgi:hypothetical protein
MSMIALPPYFSTALYSQQVGNPVGLRAKCIVNTRQKVIITQVLDDRWITSEAHHGSECDIIPKFQNDAEFMQ